MEPVLGPNAAFAAVLLVVTFAAAVKSALGFGFPLISVPIAANLIGARQAVLLIAIPVITTNFAILLRGGGFFAARAGGEDGRNGDPGLRSARGGS